jgi:hypothetical protein
MDIRTEKMLFKEKRQKEKAADPSGKVSGQYLQQSKL